MRLYTEAIKTEEDEERATLATFNLLIESYEASLEFQSRNCLAQRWFYSQGHDPDPNVYLEIWKSAFGKGSKSYMSKSELFNCLVMEQMDRWYPIYLPRLLLKLRVLEIKPFPYAKSCPDCGLEVAYKGKLSRHNSTPNMWCPGSGKKTVA